jgi:hypothetical protein
MKVIKSTDGKTKVYSDTADVEKSVKTSVKWRKGIRVLKNNKFKTLLRAWK